VVQRPFFPEGQAVCHAYILHPPGGIVPGDALGLDMEIETGAHALMTTPAGTYTLEVSSQGFTTSRQTGIVLQVGDSLTENINLTIGASEQITVSESGPLLQTEDSNVSTEIDQKQVEELPLNLRNVVGLVLLNS